MKTHPLRGRAFAAVAAAVLSLCSVAWGDLLSRHEFRAKVRPDAEVIPVPLADPPPVIDGDLGDPAWENAFYTERFTWGGGREAKNRTRMWLLRDERNLYIAFRNDTTPGVEIAARFPEGYSGGGVWGDECVDFKLSGDGFVTSCQFIVSAAGASYEARNARADWSPTWQRAARMGENEYTIEIAIPLAALRVSRPQPGHPVFASFNRADRSAGQLLSLTEPYGELEQGVILALGAAEDYENLLASGVLSRQVSITLHLDRDQYPSFQRLATGRVQLASPQTGGRLHAQAALVLALLREDEEIGVQRLQPVLTEKLDFDLPLANLAPGEYVLEARAMDGDEVLATARQDFRVREASAQRAGAVPLTVPPADGELDAWPITFGVPFAWGALDSVDHLRMEDAQGREVPIQVEPTSRWSREGSLRWALVDAVVPARREAAQYRIVYGPEVQRAPVQDGVQVAEDGGTITVDNGPLRLVFRKSGRPGLDEIWADLDGDGQFGRNERMVKMDAGSGPTMTDEAGLKHFGALDEAAEVVVEDVGPLKACVRVSGWHVAEKGERLGRFILRYYVYRDIPVVRLYHTFIITESSNEATAGIEQETRYRNIAYEMPFPVLTYFFGTPFINTGSIRGDNTAYLLQHDDVTCRIFRNGRFDDECVKAEGWMVAGGGARWMTLAVRDFWQQFPKELEVSRDRVNVHFWPKHGEPNRRTGENLSIKNVYQLWFSHAGEALDFKVPDEALEYVRQDSERHNWPHAKVANAMGLAKTHEMLLYFHAEDWETARSRTTAQVFQSNPTAAVDPAYVCATEVFGKMAPHDPERFPEVERVVDECIQNIYRQQEMGRDYGMFNFGDSHHNWFWQERRWNLHRIWYNTHHGWTRWPWLMYARTGRHDLYQWGDRNARRAADVGHVHHTTDDFVTLPYPGHKILGGLCDYKGFVHWASGGRFCYNSSADSLLHHYYFTGNKRSLETALAHGKGLVDHGRAHAHREGSGRLTSAAELYFQTWDNDYLDFVRRTADALLSTQRENGSFPQWENFAPYLQRYVNLTRSQRGMEAMARWGDFIVDKNTVVAQHHAKINILAHAYLYTGDPKYLPVAALRVNEVVDNQYLGEDPRYYGMFLQGHSNLGQSYFMQEFPYYLEALRRHGREVAPSVPECASIRTLSREEIGGERPYVFRAHVRRETGAAFTLPFNFRGATDHAYRVEARPAGGGEPLVAGGATPGHLNRLSLELEIPAGAEREFEVLVISDKNFYTDLPLSRGMEGIKEVYPIFPQGVVIGGKPPIRFNVPRGAERFRLVYQGRAWPLKAELFDPDGAQVGEDVWIGSNRMGTPPRKMGAEVGGRREGWTFMVTGYGMCTLLGFEVEPAEAAQPLHFSFDKAKLFDPAR